MNYHVGDIIKVKTYGRYGDEKLYVSKDGSKVDFLKFLEVEIIGVDEADKEYLIDLTEYDVVYPTIKEGSFSEDIFGQFSLNPKNYDESMIICRIYESGIISRVRGVMKAV